MNLKGKLVVGAFTLIEIALLTVYALQLTTTIFTYDKGYWVLLSAALVAVCFATYELQSSSRVLAGLYILASLSIVASIVSTGLLLQLEDLVNLGIVYKILFNVVAWITATTTAVMLIREYLFGAKLKRKLAVFDKGTSDDSETKKSYGICHKYLFPAFAVLVAFSVVLASVNSVVVVNELFQPLPSEGTFVNIGTSNVFVRCIGSGSPPVIFIHGLAGNSLDFSWMQEEIAKVTRTCSIDRPGHGYSRTRGVLPRTAEQNANELHTVLTSLGITGDIIGVAHSFGSYIIRNYNAIFPGRLKGLVLMDPLNIEDTPVFECNPNRNFLYAPNYYAALMFADSGFMRVFDIFGLWDTIAPISALPGSGYDEYRVNLRSPYFQTSIDEFYVIGQSCSSVQEIVDGGEDLDIPLSVVIAENGIYKGNLNAGTNQESLSSNGTSLIIPGAFHSGMILREEFANFTTQEILKLLQAYNS